MFRSTAWAVLRGWLCCVPLAGGAVELQSIRIERPGDDPGYLQPMAWTAPVPSRLAAELEMGDDLEGAILSLQPAPGDADARYRVMVEFETSLALGDEGPHLDLLDWRHCRSAWRPAAATGPRAWRLPMATDDERSCVPAASRQDLVAATRAALATRDPPDRPRWMALARSVDVVGEWPSYVSISTVRVRIETEAANGWRELVTIAFRVPMGC